MPVATVAVDLAKNVFELAAADEQGKVVSRKRLTRLQFTRYFDNHPPIHVVMEACGTAHHWARRLSERGMRVSLLPPHYVKAYVRRNKTDAADATALLEASRACDITPVQVKSIEQQALQGLHRIRAAWRRTRTARVNTLRGLCREFGISAPLGRKRGLAALQEALQAEECDVPEFLRRMFVGLLQEIQELDARVAALEGQLQELAQLSPECQRLQTVPGVGLIVSTAFVGAVGDITGFRSARRFASWLGLTPREHSSAGVRHLGSISKRGDCYLRMLLVHGARAVLYSADAAVKAGRPLDALGHFGIRVRSRGGHNKAAVAVANKLARIIWATWRYGTDFQFRPMPVPTA